MRQGELFDTLPRWRPHRSARIEGADVRTLGRDTAAAGSSSAEGPAEALTVPHKRLHQARPAPAALSRRRLVLLRSAPRPNLKTGWHSRGLHSYYSIIRNNFSTRTLLCSLWLGANVIDGREGCAWLPFSGRARSHAMTGWTAQRCRILNCYATWRSSSKLPEERALVRQRRRSGCRFLPCLAELLCLSRWWGCGSWIAPPASWR